MVVVRGGWLGGPGIEKTAPRIVIARGSDCGGTHGTTGRTLNLSGVAINEVIYVQGAYLHDPDYSKSTVGGVSRITFTNKVYDPFYIDIYYWV